MAYSLYEKAEVSQNTVQYNKKIKIMKEKLRTQTWLTESNTHIHLLVIRKSNERNTTHIHKHKSTTEENVSKVMNKL